MLEVSTGFVIAMGIITVFVGLICIIIICMVMGKICQASANRKKAALAAAAPAPVAAPAPHRQAMIAAIAVAIAEDLGTDAAGIRILSVKKI